MTRANFITMEFISTTLLVSGILVLASILAYAVRRPHRKIGIPFLVIGVLSPLMFGSCSDKSDTDSKLGSLSDTCSVYDTFQYTLERRAKAIGEFTELDGFLQGAGLSNHVRNAFIDFQRDLEAFRMHLLTCSTRHCRERAATEIRQADEIIQLMRDMRDVCGLFDLIRAFGSR